MLIVGRLYIDTIKKVPLYEEIVLTVNCYFGLFCRPVDTANA